MCERKQESRRRQLLSKTTASLCQVQPELADDDQYLLNYLKKVIQINDAINWAQARKFRTVRLAADSR